MHTKLLSILFLILGIACFLLFLPPYTKAIINIGNITGMLLAFLLIVYGLFFTKINHTLVIFWKNRTGKLVLSAAAVLCVIILVLTVMMTSCMIKAATKKTPENTTAVVLGCAVHGTSPSLMLSRRLSAALSYLEENKEAHAILSGGKGPGEDITEAECMFLYLTSHGISKERLHLEDRSENTAQNILYSKKILAGISSSQDIAIITNEFHQYRAGILAENAGLHPYSVNGKTVSYLLPTYYVRELFAILKEWVL